MPNMTRDTVKRCEQRDVGLDDQKMAEINDAILRTTRERDKINRKLRRLRTHRDLILQRRHLTDTAV
jgi:hypothetical protein